jgi:hypothetical protein
MSYKYEIKCGILYSNSIFYNNMLMITIMKETKYFHLNLVVERIQFPIRIYELSVANFHLQTDYPHRSLRNLQQLLHVNDRIMSQIGGRGGAVVTVPRYKSESH